MSQTNVKTGPIVVACGEDLTNAADHLVVLSSNAGEPQMLLPNSIDDPSIYLVLEGAGNGELGSFLPLHSGKNVRVPLVGTCTPGDTMILANPAVAGQPGKVLVLPSGLEPGTYRIVGIAEEAGADGQLLLVRPIPFGAITVT